MKRFWEQARVVAGPDGFSVVLDGKPMHLPGGDVLRVPHAAIAAALAEEWQAAGGAPGGDFAADDTPLTRLAGTAQVRIAPDPAPTVDAIAAYAGSDLLCYRAEGPEPLVRRQARAWQPWLDWAALAYDAPLRVTHGVVHVRQDAAPLLALHRAVAARDSFTLAGLGIAVPALGSLVLGLALADGKLDAPAAHALAALDELYQAELWGEDDEGVRRRAAVADDIAVAARLMALVRS